MSPSRFALFSGFLAVALHMTAVSISAQPVWTDKFSARGVTIDYLKPFLKDKTITGATSITFLSARIPISDRMRLKPEIPIGYVSIQSAGPTENTTVLGNPYLGLEVLGSDGTSTAEIGLRLPTIYSETPLTQIAIATDFDRFESFAEETAAITGSFVGRNKSDAVQMEVAGGVTVLVPFNDKETEIYGQYAGQLVFKTAKVGFITGITGRILFTEPNINFGQRSTHQVGFSMIGYFGNFRPGIMGRLAFDKPLRNLINGVVGLNASYEIR
ncbi:MAG: hypothetical protein ACC655_07100 [Rhodothermia bacterium]